MLRSGPGSRLRMGLRAGLVTVALLVATRLLGAAWASAWDKVHAPGPASTDELLALAVAGLASGVAAWLVCGTVFELAAHLPGRVGRAADRSSHRATPALGRRVAGFVLGVGVGVVGGPTQGVATQGVATQSVATQSVATRGVATQGVAAGPTVAVDATQAGSQQAPDPGFRATPPTPSTAPTPAPVRPGFTPAAPRVRPQADPRLLGARATAAITDEVVVHRGDSLWSIAARHLGPGASAAEIDRSWRQWFSLNRDRIGADPDLILPGQVLRTPDADTSASAVR